MNNKILWSKVKSKFAKYICLNYNCLQLSMNNRNIRTKIINLYIFCVLVPVVLTNALIIGSTLKASRDAARANRNNIADSVAHDISSFIENAVYVTVDMYASDSICNFLDAQYDNREDFLKKYNRVFDNYIFYRSSKNLVSDITLYSDNKTMSNGGRYFRIDAVLSEEWYRSFVEANTDLMIYPYNNTGYSYQNKRMISVIRKLNYIEMSRNEKIVKLDLNYAQLDEAIKSSAFNTVVYVCHKGQILFSNDKNDIGINTAYENSSKISMNEIQLHKAFSSYGFSYDVYLKGYKSNYISMLRDKLWLIAALLLVDALLPAFMLTLFSDSITKRILLLGEYMKKIKGDKFDLILQDKGKDEIGELLDNYNLMVVRMKNLIESEYKGKLEQQELRLARQQAELLALYSQINPHFMFNVLESIRMRSLIKGENETSQMIEGLAKLMRKSAEWGSDLITLFEEVGFMEDYLKLQKYRYGENFNYKFRIEVKCNAYKIPSLVLVTFVENACIHGLNREGHTGTIFVTAKEEHAVLHIEIEDTGIGMEPEQVKELEKLLNEANIDDLQKTSSLGMLNACIRLKKYCGIKTEIAIESEKQVGTCIIIRIPLEKLKENI
jgi:Predicted signal transduction protein with a C-terminal ATPase domain